MKKITRSFFHSLRMKTRLFLGFGFMIFFIISVGIFAIMQMNVLAEQTQKLYNHPLTVNSAARDFSIGVLKMRTMMLGGILLAKTPSELDNTAKKMDALDIDIKSNLDIVRARYLGDPADIDNLEKLFNTWKPIRDEVINLARIGSREEAITIAKEGKLAQHINKLVDASNVVTDFAKRKAESFIEHANVVATNSRHLMIIVISTIFIIGLWIMWSISNAITKPVYRAVQMADRIAAGHLSNHVEVDNSRDEIGQLMQTLAVMTNKLIEIITTIKQTASAVNKAASEISQGNLSLSQRTEEQAASLEQTAASMEEMTSTVEQNANNANQATLLASSARERAQQGGKIVANAINAMNEINVSSKKVSNIISVINDIAFQTNLLALNAAVEAARAGEQGRGFAVVASEVRNLAQRSATAAKEIKELIQDSVVKVEEGTKLVNQSGEALDEIVIAVKKVSDIIIEIAAASQEQSSGIRQVNKAVTQMDEMTQQNAALVEEAASASESMSKQAEYLNQQVAFFHIDNQVVYQELEEYTAKSTQAIPPVATTHPVSTPKLAKLRRHNHTSHDDEDDSGWRDF